MKAAILSIFLAMPALAADPAATAINELGLDLHRRIAAAKSGENLCLSPYSIQCALAMTYAGADGQTRTEMSTVLHYLQGDGIHESLSALSKALTQITQRTTELAARAKKYGGSAEPVTLTLANRLFGAQGHAFHGPFLNLLRDAYHAPLEPTDFAKPEVVTKHINGWVEKETQERIKDLLPDGLLNAATRLVLVNAVYLKAPWANKFEEAATKPEPFHLVGGTKKDVPTMLHQYHVGYAKRDGYAAISIPYFGGGLQFLILLPDDVQGLAAMEKALTATALAECAQLPRTEVILHLPKFKIEGASVSLSKELQDLGMKTAFDVPPGSADFSQMAPRTPKDYLFISEVVHKTFLAVDEKGTEAAAATAVLMGVGSAAPVAKPQPIEVRVDHPFFFAIQHNATGACLFLGRVTNPL